MECAVISKEHLNACPETNKLFPKESQLLIHMSEASYICEVCDQLFNEEKQLKEHHLTHEKEVGYVREVSNKRFDVKEQLNTVKECYFCEVCKEKFGAEEQLTEHFHTHKGEEFYVCDETFDEKGKLKEHFLTDEEESYAHEVGKERFDEHKLTEHVHTPAMDVPNKKCDKEKELTKKEVCNKSFSKELKLKKQLLNQSKDPFMCEVCNKRFSRKGYLMRHRGIHTREHVCKICGESFPANSFLRMHMFLHNIYNPLKHICKICGKSFSDKEKFQKHRQIHERKKTDHKCKMCKKMFAEEYLLPHCNVRSDKKLFVCLVCSSAQAGISKKGSALSKKEKPLKKPLAKKPFVCRKEFDWKSKLELHSISHTKEKNHVCGTCWKAFSRSDHLRRHLVTHKLVPTCLKPACGICGKTFSRSDHLKAHLKTHNKKLVSICPASVSVKSS